MSTGLTFGFKLPTGDFTHNDAYDDIDRDSQLGTGSTDLLLGGFHRQNLPWDNNNWTWFTQAQMDLPITSQANYTPGMQIDAATGIYYSGFSIHGVKISPVLQVIGTERLRDFGSESAKPIASGFQRILISPGLEVDWHPFRFYADAEVPVFQDFRGDQLVAPVLMKASFAYMF
jgi:hypothetical protein